MVNIFKKGYRVLGIAESFVKNKRYSILCGVVYRRDNVIDGIQCSKIHVGGLDATEGVLRIYEKLARTDINLILTNGCIVSWFNIIDIEKVYRTLKVPIICITYEESEGIEKYIRKYFGEDENRIQLYRKLGGRDKIYIKKSKRYVYVRYYGLTLEEVRILINSLIRFGAVPEPLRLANLIARAFLKIFYCEDFQYNERK